MEVTRCCVAGLEKLYVAKEEVIEKWIQKRGPSFFRRNVIDARCLCEIHQRQLFVSVTCQFSLVCLSSNLILVPG